jgi:cytochrome c biogenesis factor
MEKRGNLVLWSLVGSVVLVIILIVFLIILSNNNSSLKSILFMLTIIFVCLIVGTIAYWYLAYPPNLIRKKLKKAKYLISEETLEITKQIYGDVYKLYTKLSEKEKQNFYSQVSKIREAIEEQLCLEKKMEELFSKARKGSLKERKIVYDLLYSTYQKLTIKTKQLHYPKIVQLREELERGRV